MIKIIIIKIIALISAIILLRLIYLLMFKK
nr:MAG TPA: Protein of unknown function (DUF2633) [Crassvirales sp.]